MDEDNNLLEYSHDYIVTGAKNIAYGLTTIVCWFAGAFVDIMKSKRMQELGLNMIMLYGKCMVQLEKWGCQLYESNETIKSTVDIYTWTREHMNLLFSRAHREPKNVNWLTSYCIQSSDRDQEHYYETYNILNDDLNAENINNLFVLNWSTNGIREHNDFNVMVKYSDLYRVRSTCRNGETNGIMEQSSFRPLSITYKAIDLSRETQPISIELPTSMWVIGNELFTPCFVRRCLEYQETPFVFSKNYEIAIMDANVNTITFNQEQYIEVSSDNIEIKQMYISLEDDSEEESIKEENPEDDSEEESIKEENPEDDSDSEYVPSEDE